MVQQIQSATDDNGHGSGGHGGGEVSWYGAKHSPQRVIGVNNATIRQNERGITAVERLIADYIREELASADEAMVNCDVVDYAAAYESCRIETLNEHPLLAPLESSADISVRREQLLALKGGRAIGSLSEWMSACCSPFVRAQFDALVQQLQQVAIQCPQAVIKEIERVETYLDAWQPDAATAAGLTQLTRLCEVIELVERETDRVPDHKRDGLVRGWLDQAQVASRTELLHHVALELQSRFERGKGELRQQLDELRWQATNWQKHLDEVIARLNEAEAQAEATAASPRTEGVILMPGPSRDECLEALCRMKRCSRSELIAHLAAAFVDQLRSRVDVVDTDGPPDDVVDVGVEIIRSLVRPHLTALNVYRALEDSDMARVGRDLFDSAEPLVHLKRQSSLLNIDTAEAAVLTVPTPGSKRDQRIVDRLTRSLAKLSRSLMVRRSSHVECCHLTRSLAGFSFPCLAHNDALVWAYVQSRVRYGHHPHLFGFGISPDGKPLMKYVDLQKRQENRRSNDGGTQTTEGTEPSQQDQAK